jgi:hypothetical protein
MHKERGFGFAGKEKKEGRRSGFEIRFCFGTGKTVKKG